MKKIAVITDSNSGITQTQAAEMGISVIPMPFTIEGKVYLEGVSLDREEFLKKLNENAEISTSQPTPATVIELWNKLLKEYEEIVHIPMSSGLSASCETATALSAEYDGKVQVVNNQRISVTQRQSVLNAIALAEQEKSAAEIKNILEAEKMDSSVYLALETLKYLKRGGRITPAAAAFGTVLNIKPILQIQGEKLDAYAKARGKLKAKRIMIDAMKSDMEKRFKDLIEQDKLALHAAYAGNPQEAAEWKAELESEFPGMEIYMDSLSLSVICHTGPGILAVACSRKV